MKELKMFEKNKYKLFAMILLMMQSLQLLSAHEFHTQPADITYKPLPVEMVPKSAQENQKMFVQKASIKPQISAIKQSQKMSVSKDDSFALSSKPVVAHKYKPQSLTLEDRPQHITTLGHDGSMPVAIAVPMDQEFADSELSHYSGLAHVDAEPVHAIAMAEAHAVTGPESYDAQGKITRKDFVDAQGNDHHITYELGVETENVLDKNGHKVQQIITQADKSSVIRLYTYNNASQTNVLQSIETKLPDGTSVFKYVYSGKMIDAQVRNKSGEVEGTTRRDDFNMIQTTTVGDTGAVTSPRRLATDLDHDAIPPRPVRDSVASGVIHNADGTTTTTSYDAQGLAIRTVKNADGQIVETFTRVGNAIENIKYDATTGKINQKNIMNDDGSEERENYRDGKLILITNYNFDGESISREKYNYDKDGELISSQKYNVDKDSNLTSTVKYNYDKDSKITSIVEYNYDKDGEIILTIEYMCDRNGEIISSEEYDKDGNIIPEAVTAS